METCLRGRFVSGSKCCYGWVLVAGWDRETISTSSRSSSLSARLGAWLTFRRSLSYETEIEQTRHFYCLFAQLNPSLFDGCRMKIESSILSSSGKELSGKSTVGAVLSMIDVFKKLQKKRRKELPYSKGGCGRERVCQVNVTRKVFEILNFVFGTCRFFFFRSPYRTVCSHMEPSAKLGSPNWTLGRKVSHQIDHRGPWSGGQKYFLVANGD